MKYLVTHDGRFHTDEVMATVVLFALFPQASLIRSRDPRVLDMIEREKHDAIIYDMGGVYDPGRRIFDHHQPSPELREDGTPYSAFGLIWREFGRFYLARRHIDRGILEDLHAEIDRRIVRPIDLADNGILPVEAMVPADLALPTMVDSFNPSFKEPGRRAEDSAFERVTTVVRSIFEAKVEALEAELSARAIVRRAIADHDGGAILELPHAIPFQQGVIDAGADNVLFVVHPRRDDWIVVGVADRTGSYDLRRDLPGAWAGLEGEALAAASGVDDAIFCHRARFMMVAKTREGAVEAARRALAPEADLAPQS